MKSNGLLIPFRDRLSAGKKILTTEFPIIHSADPRKTTAQVHYLRGIVDAVNVADNASARAHISPLAVARLLIDAGLEPIMHLTCRDRNRLALQADIVGAAMLGIRNFLCLTGDDVTAGDQPESRRVFDMDSLQLLAVARSLSRGHYLSGKSIEDMPALFLGASENPSAPPLDHRSARALKKCSAGAEFFQLQIVFNRAFLKDFLEACAVNGTSSRSSILPTIFVPASVSNLRYLEKCVPGITVPLNLIQEIERFDQNGQRQACLERSLAMAADIISLPGVAGLHVISFQGLEILSEFRDLIEQRNNRLVA